MLWRVSVHLVGGFSYIPYTLCSWQKEQKVSSDRGKGLDVPQETTRSDQRKQNILVCTNCICSLRIQNSHQNEILGVKLSAKHCYFELTIPDWINKVLKRLRVFGCCDQLRMAVSTTGYFWHVSAFKSLTSLHIFKETSGQFPAVFVVTKTGVLSQDVIFFESLPSGFCAKTWSEHRYSIVTTWSWKKCQVAT